MNRFEYQRAIAQGEAMSLVSADEQSTFLAGGTDLVTLLKAGLTEPGLLVDIKRVDTLKGITETRDGGLRIGALTTLSALERSPQVLRDYPIVAEALRRAATVQIRNRATAGGNLLQRPRCWYFRNPHIPCWLKGGDDCPAVEGESQHHAIFGGGPCHAAHPSDLAPALIALGAEVETVGVEGTYERIPLSEFYRPPEEGRRSETTLRYGDLVSAVYLPPRLPDTRMSFLKAMERKTWTFALASVAVVYRDGPRMEDVRIVAGGVSAIPWRLVDAERMLTGEAYSQAIVESAADVAGAAAEPLARNGYKVPLLKGLIIEAMESTRR